MSKCAYRDLFLKVLITVLIICCFLLCIQIYNLNERLDSLEAQLENLSQATAEQQAYVTLPPDRGQTSENPMMSDVSGGNVSMDAPAGTDSEMQQQEELHKVYLTFDDGPSKYTDEILDILERYDVKATFFVLGKEEQSAREALLRIAEKGHTIGLHSYSHKYDDIYSSVDAFAEDYLRLQDYVYRVTGQKSQIYRFPGGSSNTVSDLDMVEFANYLHEQDVEFFDWNVSSGDGGSRLLDVETLVENSTIGITDRDPTVILMHDAADKSTTIEALPIIIEKILAMENTVILPITEDTKPVQHIKTEVNR